MMGAFWKTAAAAALAMTILAGSAHAQAGAGVMDDPTAEQIAAAPPSRCAAFPDAPELPEASRSNYREMERGNERYNAWITELRAAFECRVAESNELRAQVLGIQATRIARANEATAATERLREVEAYWQAQTQEFNRGR